MSASTPPPPSYLFPSADAHVLVLIFLISCLIVICGYVAYNVQNHGDESFARALQDQKIFWEQTLNRRARRTILAHMLKTQEQVDKSRVLAHLSRQPLVTKIRNMENCQTQLQENFNSLKKAQEDILQSLSDHKQQFKNEREADRLAISKANTKVQDLTKTLHKLKDDHDDLSKAHEATNSKLDKKDGELHDLQKALKATNSSLDSKSDELQKLQKSFKATNSKLDTKTGEFHDLEKALKTTNSSLEVKADEIQALQESLEATNNKHGTNIGELEKLQKAYQATDNKLGTKDKELHDLQNALETTNNILSTKVDELHKLQEEHEVAFSALKEARTDLTGLHDTAKTHSEEKTAMQQQMNQLQDSVKVVINGKAELHDGLHKLQQAHEVTSGALEQTATELTGLQTSTQTRFDEKATVKQQIEHLQASVKAVVDDKENLQKQMHEIDFDTVKQAVAANDTKLSKLCHAVVELAQHAAADRDLENTSVAAETELEKDRGSVSSITNTASSEDFPSDLVASSQASPPLMQNGLLTNLQEADKKNKHSPGHKKRRRRKHGHNKFNQAPLQANDDEDSDSETESGSKLGPQSQSFPASSSNTKPVSHPTQGSNLNQSTGKKSGPESLSSPESSSITAPASNPDQTNDIQPSPGDELESESQSTPAPSSITEEISCPTQADDPAAPGYTTRDSVKASRHAPLTAPAASNSSSINPLAASKFASPSIATQAAVGISVSANLLAASKFAGHSILTQEGVNTSTSTDALAASKFAGPLICTQGVVGTPTFTNALAGSKFAGFGLEYHTKVGQGPYPSQSSQPGYKAPVSTTTCSLGHHHVPNRDFCYNYDSRQYYTPDEPCDLQPAVLGNAPKPPLSTVHPLAHLNPPTAPKSILLLGNQKGEDKGSMALSKYAPKLYQKEPENINKFRGHGPDGQKARRREERAIEFDSAPQQVPTPINDSGSPMNSIPGSHQPDEKASAGLASVQASKYAY